MNEEVLTKLQIGIKGYYDGDFEDDDGRDIESAIIASGLTLAEYQLCKDYVSAHQDYHAYDTVNYGCDCGCGGDSMDLDEVEEMENSAIKRMNEIANQLGLPPDWMDE